MSLFDDYEFYPDDDDDDQGVTCKRCGAMGLEWIDTGGRNRLIDAEGRFHICNNDNAVDDFEVLG